MRCNPGNCALIHAKTVASSPAGRALAPVRNRTGRPWPTVRDTTRCDPFGGLLFDRDSPCEHHRPRDGTRRFDPVPRDEKRQAVEPLLHGQPQPSQHAGRGGFTGYDPGGARSQPRRRWCRRWDPDLRSRRGKGKKKKKKRRVWKIFLIPPKKKIVFFVFFGGPKKKTRGLAPRRGGGKERRSKTHPARARKLNISQGFF